MGPAPDHDAVEARMLARRARQRLARADARTATASCRDEREATARPRDERLAEVLRAPTRSSAQPSARSRAAPSAIARRRCEQGKLPVRERVALLLDEDSFAEEALLANWQEDGLGADGVVTGVGDVDGRPVALMANDPTVKAGSWGPEDGREDPAHPGTRALALAIPMVYLVDSAGARITEQVQMFPGRRGAGRIFHNQVKLSGVVPQVCVLFGPSAAGGAYIPAFCDVVIMREGNASMYLGSPRMAEMVIGEKVTPRGDGRRADAHRRLRLRAPARAQATRRASPSARRYLSYLPGELASSSRRGAAPASPAGRRRRHDRGADPRRREQAVRHAGADRRARRRGLAARDPPALGAGS